MHSPKNGPIRVDFAVALSSQEAQDLVAEINAIYLEEEGVIWPDDGSYERINESELLEFVENGSLIIAKTETDRIVGTVRIYQYEGLWYFGLLTTHRNFRSRGIAGKLMYFLETYLKTKGVSELYIELLFAQDFEMPNKTGLESWYKNKGFSYVETVPFLDRAPHMKDIIKHNCDFKIMKKSLD